MKVGRGVDLKIGAGTSLPIDMGIGLGIDVRVRLGIDIGVGLNAGLEVADLMIRLGMVLVIEPWVLLRLGSIFDRKAGAKSRGRC